MRAPKEPLTKIKGPVKRPIGRPPATDSAETRAKILAAARECYGRQGYDQTTNKDVAEAAGITPGAIYHYFPLKQELFAAVYRESQDIVFNAFEIALQGPVALAEKISALMDSVVKIHTQDRTVAAFIAIAPIELQRHQTLRDAVGEEVHRVTKFFTSIVMDSRADLHPTLDPRSAVDLLVAVSAGLTQFGATRRGLHHHRSATATFKRLVDSTFFAASDGNTGSNTT